MHEAVATLLPKDAPLPVSHVPLVMHNALVRGKAERESALLDIGVEARSLVQTRRPYDCPAALNCRLVGHATARCRRVANRVADDACGIRKPGCV